MQFDKNENIKVAIYIIAILYFIFKASFYTEIVGGFPDESQHIAYIAYLENTDKIIPEFKDKKGITMISDNKYVWNDSTSYLGHPPLYYHVMRLANAIKFNNDTINIDIMRLRYFNMLIAVFGMTLILYIGYRINMPLLYHAFFAVACTSVPMISYLAGGVNNDNLCLAGAAILILGLYKVAENEYEYSSYIFVGIGFLISMLTKLTAGYIVTLTLCLFTVYKVYKDRNIKFIINKKFMLTLPFYIIPLFYYTKIFMKYSTFQPSLKIIAPSEFFKSGFYVPEENRMSLSFISYAVYFVKSFLMTWDSVFSHISCLKPSLISGISILLLLFIPVVVIIFDKKIKDMRTIECNSLIIVSKCMALSGIIVFLTQLLRQYKGYLINGYLGGFQSRYYLLIIPALALLNIKLLLKVPGRLLHNLIIGLYITLLIYQDFIYFLIHYSFI